MVCPKCSSENVIVQRENVGNVSTAKTKYYKKHHGLFYWLFIGWWIGMFKLLFIPFTILFGGKSKSKGYARTNSASKTINQTVAVCQECGNTWKIK